MTSLRCHLRIGDRAQVTLGIGMFALGYLLLGAFPFLVGRFALPQTTGLVAAAMVVIGASGMHLPMGSS